MLHELQRRYGRALYYRAHARADLGDHAGACADYAATRSATGLDAVDAVRIELAEALCRLAEALPAGLARLALNRSADLLEQLIHGAPPALS